MKTQITLVLDHATKQMAIDAPIENWPLCYQMLDAGKDLIMRSHAERLSRQAIVAAPANALDQLPTGQLIK